MPAKIRKVAYAIFLLSFGLWLAIVIAAFCPAVTNAEQIQFPHPTVQTVFLGSAFTSSIACMLIGLDYLGRGTTIGKKTATLPKPKLTTAKLQTQWIVLA